jgi:hypothetical protein
MFAKSMQSWAEKKHFTLHRAGLPNREIASVKLLENEYHRKMLEK